MFALVCICVWVTEGNTKRDRKRKPGFMFVCLHHMHYVFDSVCASVCPSICVCVHADAWIAYLPRFGWLHRLVLGTGPDCPSANITRPKFTLSTSWYTQIHTNTHKHKAPGNNAGWSLPMFPQTLLTHTQCLYTHGTFFHRLSYQFNQEMENKQYFCAAVFVFDKWFIWWKVWSRPCPQYLFQAAADSSRSLAEYL